jgi:xanthine dehydrogenase accessory factor
MQILNSLATELEEGDMATTTWSASETDVLKNIQSLIESDQQGVLATIVAVEGNAYRRPGAKMVIPRDSDSVGNITAGCLTDEVRTLARHVLEDGHPRVETFDLMNNDIWGLGIGCNGIIDLLIEPIREGHHTMYEIPRSGESVTISTILSSDSRATDQWTKVCYDATGETKVLTGTVGQRVLEHIKVVSEKVQQSEIPTSVSFEQNSESTKIFVDKITPPPKLVVVGTGHDANPIVELGKQNGFHVTVVGYRGATTNKKDFPDADRVISTSPRNICDEIEFTENTYTVIANHNLVDDRITLNEVVQEPVRYIGLMGPQKRFEHMCERSESEGQILTELELEKIYCPIGLNLGASSPYGIATSIIAEVLSVHNRREPMHLVDYEGPIHDRSNI